jgi:DNA repair exonuclease SbcCD ATPase subunit
MSLRTSLLVILSLLSALPAALFAADPPNPAEAKLRESLRNTMLQLRTTETERAALQATQAELEQKNAALIAQLESLNSRMAVEKQASEKASEELKSSVEERDTEIRRLNQSLNEWKSAHKQVSTLAANTEAQRAKLAANVIVLNRRVADQQVKNAEMFKIGNELLDRYEKFGLGDALTAREPFIGLTRVKFENLIQDYQDKINDGKIQPVEEKPAGSKTSPTSAPKTKAAASKPAEPKAKS